MNYQKGTFTVVPTLHMVGLTPHEQLVFVWMCFYANQEGECFPSYRTLMKVSGLSKDAIIRAIKKLIARGILEKAKRRRDCGGNTSNLYRIVIHRGGSLTATTLVAVSDSINYIQDNYKKAAPKNCVDNQPTVTMNGYPACERCNYPDIPGFCCCDE